MVKPWIKFEDGCFWGGIGSTLIGGRDNIKKANRWEAPKQKFYRSFAFLDYSTLVLINLLNNI